jgi:hypothetical protein
MTPGSEKDYKPTYLKGISPPRFGCARKELWVIFSEFFFMLLGSFVSGVMTPLYFAHLDDFIVSHPFCHI